MYQVPSKLPIDTTVPSQRDAKGQYNSICVSFCQAAVKPAPSSALRLYMLLPFSPKCIQVDAVLGPHTLKHSCAVSPPGRCQSSTLHVRVIAVKPQITKRACFIAVLLACAAYPPLYPGFPMSALDTPLKYHEQELSYAGINLKNLVNNMGKKVDAGPVTLCAIVVQAWEQH